MSAPGGDGLPWYRHVWPWFIVGLMALSIGASLATVVVAYRGQDALVRDDWYDEGVSINRSLAQLERARALGIRAALHFAPPASGDRLGVDLQGDEIGGVERLVLPLSHATRAELDRSVSVERVAPGRYEGELAPPPPGRFYAILEPLAGGDAVPDWRLTRAFYAGASATVELGDGR